MFTFIICRDTNEEISSYEDYLLSQHWKNIKQKYLEKYGDKCKICGKSGLDLHHISYLKLGNEGLNDLVLLCRDCHIQQHIDELNYEVD